MRLTLVLFTLLLLLAAPRALANEDHDVDALRRAWQADPGALAHGLALYEALHARGEATKARRIFRAHVRDKRLSRERRFLAGLALGGRRGLREMRRALGDDTLGLTKEQRLLRARVLRAVLTAEEAVEPDPNLVAETALKLANATGCPRDLTQAGVRLERAGRMAEAKTAYERALNHCCHHEEPRNRLVMLHAARGDLDSARMLAEATARRHSSSAAAHLHLGIVLAMRSEHEASIEAFARAEAAAGEDPSLLAAVGGAYAQIERYDAARRLLERALALEPKHGAALVHLAMVHMARQEAPQAARILRRAAAAHPRDAEIAFLQGVAAEKRGQRGSAARAYKRAIRLDARRADYVLSLALVLIDMRKWTAAEKALREVTELLPNSTTPWLHLAVVSFEGRRDRRAARDALRTYRDRGGDDPVMLAWLEDLEQNR